MMEDGQSLDKNLQEAQWFLAEARDRNQKLEQELRDKNQHIEKIEGELRKLRKNFDESQWYLGEERARKEQLESALNESTLRIQQLDLQIMRLGTQSQAGPDVSRDGKSPLGEERATLPGVDPFHAKVNVNKVLIADDDPTFQKLYGTAFKQAGYAVSEALNGQEAIDAIEKDEPDLLVLDVLMPGLNGHEVINKIKFNSPFADLPIIVVSSGRQVMDPHMSSLLGIDYMHKPFSPQELLKRADKILNVKR
jgi:CheY-like chemotaxis protein